MGKRAVILAEGFLGSLTGKTANILVMYSGRKFDIVAVIDSRYAGRDAGEVLGLSKLGIPVVASLDEALVYRPEVLIVGVATIGGVLPEHHRAVIRRAIECGLEIWSGLHYFLSEDPEFSKLASEHGVRIVDVRKPRRELLRIWSGDVRKTRCGRVLIAGTDCVVGKNVTVLEVCSELEKRGYRVGVVGTGQTMIMVGAHRGTVIDAVPSDFCPGVVELHVLELDKEGYNPVLVEGQASVLHPAYGQVSVAILYGCWPDAVILAHDPWRKFRDGFTVPMEPLIREIRAIEFLVPSSKVVAISIMGYGRSRDEILEMCEKIEREIGLPAADPRRDPGRLVDSVLDRLHSIGKL